MQFIPAEQSESTEQSRRGMQTPPIQSHGFWKHIGFPDQMQSSALMQSAGAEVAVAAKVVASLLV